MCDQNVFWLSGLSLTGGWLTGIVQVILIYMYFNLFSVGAIWVSGLWSVCDQNVFWLSGLSLTGGWLTGIVQVILIYMYFNFHQDHQKVITKHDWEKR